MYGLSHLILTLTLLGGGMPLHTDPRLVDVGGSGEWSASLILIDELQRGGGHAEAATLAMGLCDDAFVHDSLIALFEDRIPGRVLLGSARDAVPMRVRAAAAVALGLDGHVAGLVALRRAADPELNHRIDPRLEDAALAGLAFSPFQGDVARWSRIATSTERDERVRRHVATGMALLSASAPRAAGRVLGRWTPCGPRWARALTAHWARGAR